MSSKFVPQWCATNSYCFWSQPGGCDTFRLSNLKSQHHHPQINYCRKKEASRHQCFRKFAPICSRCGVSSHWLIWTLANLLCGRKTNYKDQISPTKTLKLKYPCGINVIRPVKRKRFVGKGLGQTGAKQVVGVVGVVPPLPFIPTSHNPNLLKKGPVFHTFQSLSFGETPGGPSARRWQGTANTACVHSSGKINFEAAHRKSPQNFSGTKKKTWPFKLRRRIWIAIFHFVKFLRG